MKKNKKAVSIVEAIIVVLIISLWLVWVYKIYTNSIRFLDWVEAKIQAIQIAREGIEAVENIRDTNWLLFSSDTKNCWRVLDYNSDCIWWTTAVEKIWWNIWDSVEYKIYRDENNRWLLAKNSSPNPNPQEETFFNVWLDSNWFYTQTWAFENNKYMKIKNFTRKLVITPWVNLKEIDSTNWSIIDDSNSPNWITVKSIVEWKDSSKSSRRIIDISLFN